MRSLVLAAALLGTLAASAQPASDAEPTPQREATDDERPADAPTARQAPAAARLSRASARDSVRAMSEAQDSARVASDTSAVASATGTGWTLLAATGVFGLIVGGLAGWGFGRRGQRPAVPAPGTTHHGMSGNLSGMHAPVPQASPMGSPEVMTLLGTINQKLDTLHGNVARLATAPPAVPPAPRPVPTPTPAPTAPRSAADAVADTFVAHCTQAGGLVSRPELFAQQLAGLLPGATVEVVYRDLDTPARPIAFDAVGGNSPAAHWLVRAGLDLLLVPQPQGAQQFRDLAPVFEGQAVPASLLYVTPARVTAQGMAYVLTQPGRVA